MILDEPTSGLDPVMQENFIKFIHEEKSRGKTILLSSHIFTEIDSTCDRIAIIKDGRIVSEFVADDLKHASKKYYMIDFKNEKNVNKFKKSINKISSAEILKIEDNKVFISLEDEDMNKAIEILSGLEINEFSNRKESLEDYFMKFYKEDKDFGGALK